MANIPNAVLYNGTVISIALFHFSKYAFIQFLYIFKKGIVWGLDFKDSDWKEAIFSWVEGCTECRVGEGRVLY